VNHHTNGFVSEAESAAASYHAAGFSVVPIRTDGTKAPAISEWQTLQRDRLSSDRLHRLFDSAGVGIIGGTVSGGLTIIDNDAPELWAAYLEDVEIEAPGLIERLPHVLTPKKGHHLYLRCEGPTPGNEKLAIGFTEREGPRREKRTLFETRGEGGYVVGVGSPAECHPTKNRYLHVGGPAIEDTPTISVEERALLFRIARRFTEAATETPRAPAPTATPRNHADGLSVGDDFNQRASWEEILDPHGWTKCGGRGTLTNWRRPGKTDPGASATTGCVSQAGNELLAVFSSNAYPFEIPAGETCGTFTKFAAYATLNHGGDFGEATRALSRLGYGPAPRAAAPAERSQAAPKQQPLEVLPWKPFPTECLPDPMRALVERGAECIGVDETFIISPAFAVAAMAIGNSRRITVNESWSEPATVWAATCGEPGTRKTPAQKLVTAPLESHQDELDDSHDNEDEKAPRAAAFVTDCTIERLAGLLHDNPRGVGMLRDELSSWFQALTRYRSQGSDAAQWLELFNDGRLHIHRKHGDQKYICVRDANVSICGSIQPQVLRRCLDGGNTENGLASRFLLANPPKRLARGFPKGVDDRTRTKWAVCVRRLLAIEMDTDATGKSTGRSLAMSPEATAVWESFYERHLVRIFEASGALAAAYSKLERYALRLGLVFHLIETASDPMGDDTADITGEAMDRAVRVVEWYIHETGRIYGRWSQGDDHDQTMRVVEWLESRGGRSTTGKMIAGKLFRCAAEAELALGPLVTARILDVETITHEGPGRPGTEYVLRSKQ